MGERTIYSPRQDIVAATVESIRHKIRSEIAASGGDFVLDLQGVEMIDSKGIGLIIATYNSLTKTGRKLILSEVIPDIVQLLRTMRLDRHFSIE